MPRPAAKNLTEKAHLDTGELRQFASSNDNEVPLRNHALGSLTYRGGGHDQHVLDADWERIPWEDVMSVMSVMMVVVLIVMVIRLVLMMVILLRPVLVTLVLLLVAIIMVHILYIVHVVHNVHLRLVVVHIGHVVLIRLMVRVADIMMCQAAIIEIERHHCRTETAGFTTSRAETSAPKHLRASQWLLASWM